MLNLLQKFTNLLAVIKWFLLIGKKFVLSIRLDKMKVLISYFPRGSVFTCNYQNLAGFKLCCAKNIVQGEPLINQIWSLYQSQTGPFCTLLVIFASVSEMVKNESGLFARS